MLLDGLIDVSCNDYEIIEDYFEDASFSYDEDNWLNISHLTLLKNSEDIINELEPMFEQTEATCFMTLLDNEYGYVKCYFEKGKKVFYCNYVMDMHYLRACNEELMKFFFEAMEHAYPILKDTYDSIYEKFNCGSKEQFWKNLCDISPETYLIVTPYCFAPLDGYFDEDIDQRMNMDDNLLVEDELFS